MRSFNAVQLPRSVTGGRPGDPKPEDTSHVWDGDVTEYEFDPQRSQQLLQQAGRAQAHQDIVVDDQDGRVTRWPLGRRWHLLLGRARRGLRKRQPQAGRRARARLAAELERQDKHWGGRGPDFAPKASNLWSTRPERVQDGSTVLINGPQFGWYNPAYTYGIGLHGAGFDVVGNTPFAYPIVLFGTNSEIAWGATAGPQDVVDMYQEKLNPARADQYWFNNAWRTMEQRKERSLAVNGGYAQVYAAQGRKFVQTMLRNYSGIWTAMILVLPHHS